MRVLVIRLGALGDIVLSFGPFAAIRAHHPNAEITLLTTRPFARWLARAPWFNSVITDDKPAWYQLHALARLRASLRGFGRVYDLQTSSRSSRYFRLTARPPWSGIARGCSLPHANPARNAMHTIERQRDQLRMAGIADVPRPNLAWTQGDPPLVPDRFALLVPGASPLRSGKRWPATHFGTLARQLRDRGLAPVVVGTLAEKALARIIRAACPEAIDLTGQTDLPALSALTARAQLAIGNDTGPMHLAAALGVRCVVLFSANSDPDLTAPRGLDGSWPIILQERALVDLSVERVAAAIL